MFYNALSLDSYPVILIRIDFVIIMEYMEGGISYSSLLILIGREDRCVISTLRRAGKCVVGMGGTYAQTLEVKQR